jgi:DNA-binding SARP family transcriptional activator/Flp pilus assembly protein TadD
MQIELRCLGRFALNVSGEEITLPSAKDRALLTILAVRGGPQPRERLADLLWGERLEMNARQSLRQALTRLRHIALVCSADRASVWLNNDVSSDVGEFLGLIKSSELVDMRRAVDIHEHVLLPGFTLDEPAFDDWLAAERSRLSELALAATDKLMSEKSLESSELSFLARRALALDPFRESAHRQLMTGLARQGLRTEALQHYHELKKLLQKELSVEPNRETQTLYQAIRSGSAEPPSATVLQRDQPRPKPNERLADALAGPRVAVMPLDNINDASCDYLCSGLAMSISAALSRFHSVQSISPTSSFQLATRPNRIQAARDDLGAAYVMEGSLTASSVGLTIELRLVDTESAVTLWSESHSRLKGDLLDLETSVSERLVARIEERIVKGETEKAHRTSEAAMAAYDCWLRGQHRMLSWTADRDRETIRWFERALAREPRFARAHSSLALYFNGEILVAPGRANDAADRQRALEHARTAVECDPMDPRSHLALGWVSFFLCDLVRAKRSFQNALRLNPHSADVLMHAALAASYLGEYAEGITLATKAIDLNPYHPDWYSSMSVQIEFLAGNFEAAAEPGENLTRAFPELGGWITAALALAGQEKAALAMKSVFLEVVRSAWVGENSMNDEDAVEWFFSVNRWLKDRDRQKLVGAFQAVSLPVPRFASGKKADHN